MKMERSLTYAIAKAKRNILEKNTVGLTIYLMRFSSTTSEKTRSKQ